MALRLGQLEHVDQAAGGGGAQARRQLALQTLEQGPGLVAERLADTAGFQITAMVRMPGRVVVRVGGLEGAVHERPRQLIAEVGAQTLSQPVPDVRVIGAGESGDGGAVDGEQGQGAGGVVAAVVGAQVDAQHGHARIHRAQGVVLAHFFRIQIVITRPCLYRAVTGQPPDIALAGGDPRRAAVAVGADHRLADAFAEKTEQLRIEAGGVGTESIVEVAAQILPGAGMGVGDQKAQPPGGYVRGGGDALGDGVMQWQRTGAEIKLHQRQRGLAGALQIKGAGLEPGSETVGFLRPGGITELGQADGGGDVHFGHPGQGLAAPRGWQRLGHLKTESLPWISKKGPGGMQQGGGEPPEQDQKDHREPPATGSPGFG